MASLRSLKDFAFAVYYTSNYDERVETPIAPNWNSSSAERFFDLEIPLHSFQTEQQKRRKRDESSRIIQSKIHQNGPELVLEQKRVSKIFKPSECVATKSYAGGKSLIPQPLSDWIRLNNEGIGKTNTA